VRQKSAPFTWSEDVDESLNFWFWLRQVGDLDDQGLSSRLRAWAGLSSPFDQHMQVSDHQRWAEYLPIGQAWRANAIGNHMTDLRRVQPRHMRAHYRALAEVGIALRVEWVMAPFGERWLIPPDVVMLGADGAPADERRTSLAAAAVALRSHAPVPPGI
jgi:hypothetical protein